MRLMLHILPLALWALSFAGCTRQPDAPRIVNIVNFIRQTDYRIDNADSLLLDATRRQIELVNHHRLPATFLIQYDALIRPEYQRLLKRRLRRGSEVGCWFEITRPHAEAAGLPWRGEHAWVSHADVAFSTGYTPRERERLTDVYMEKFREIFGSYPRSVGSWYIDAHTLAYMHDKYGIVASCNCKDQLGTDGYTLWGGYWNQAYYPSRRNGYMPAQTVEGQIPVPVFRMLGSDPIYQYEQGIGSPSQGVVSLEPVYDHAGKDRRWVEWFLESLAEQPCLAFGYAQAGQENSFTWEAMREGLEMQLPLLDSLRRARKIRVETLGASGRWFRKRFATTPATAVTVLRDIRGEGNRTVWFDSRYYRAGVLWRNGELAIRDMHLFDERMPSAYVDRKGEGRQFRFFTLPVVDGHRWSTPDDRAGLRLVRLTAAGEAHPLMLSEMIITEPADGTLQIRCVDAQGHPFRMTFTETQFEAVCETADRDFRWSLDLHAAPAAELPFTTVDTARIAARFQGFDYAVVCRAGRAVTECGEALRLLPCDNRIAIDCTNERPEPAATPEIRHDDIPTH